MSRHFSLGTISAGAAFFPIAFIMLFSGIYLYAVCVLVYSVPCLAAYRKSPARFWQPFTLLSVFGTILITYCVTYAWVREIGGQQAVGFPIEQGPDLGTQALAGPNALMISGVCLLPLAALSTFDTIRKKPKAKTSAE